MPRHIRFAKLPLPKDCRQLPVHGSLRLWTPRFHPRQTKITKITVLTDQTNDAPQQQTRITFLARQPGNRGSMVSR